MTVLATQAEGTTLIHDWMYELRLFALEQLSGMGADLFLYDPHRMIVNGPTRLRARSLDSRDLRSGMAMIAAALVAEGQSEVAAAGDGGTRLRAARGPVAVAGSERLETRVIRLLLVEAQLAGVDLVAGRDGQVPIQLGPASPDPPPPGAVLDQGEIEVGHDHGLGGLPGLREDAPVGSMIIELPVRTSSSSGPTPFEKTTKTPLSWARVGSHRRSHSRPFGPRSSASMLSGSCSRLSQSARSTTPMMFGFFEPHPPVWWGASRISAPWSVVSLTFSPMLLS